LAKAGTHVRNGDVVAQFDPQNQLQRLDDYKDTVVQLENSVKGMMASLAAVKESHSQAVRSAKAEWDKAILDLQTGPVHSEIDVEKYKLAVEEQQATYKELLAESDLVEESQRAQIRISELNRDQAKIELQRAQTNVERMTVRAPMSGIVVMESIVRNGEFGQIREGDQVFAGQPFVSIVDPTSMVLNAAINQVDVERLRLGMKAAIHLDAYPSLSFTGTVTGIGALARTGMSRATYVAEVPVRLKIEGLDPRLIPDLTGSAEIDMGSESNAVIVPRQAVFEENGEPMVYVQRAEGWAKESVTLGIESATTVAVHSGLHAGDVVALQIPR
jgi:HlyD family secretion protein